MTPPSQASPTARFGLRRPAALRRPARPSFTPTGEDHTVTTLELFFDLVFVFAITQVTAFMADDLGWRGALRGLVLLALLWWAWCSYAWLGNQARADEGAVRVAMIVAMAALFLVALTIPEAWGDQADGLHAPAVLAVALAVVRLGHLGVYALAARGDAGLRRTLVRTAVPVTAAAALLVTGAVAGGAVQTGLWALALAVDYTGVYLSGTDWRLPAPGHFAERHGLIVIIALGESIIAVGAGVSGMPITVPVITAGLLGLAVSVGLWWTYFDVVATAAERALHRRTGSDRVALARDSYTYLHFPMIAGVIYLALGLKKVTQYVADGKHELTDPLPATAAWALFGGVALYFLAHVAFRLRNVGSISRSRSVVAAVLIVAAPTAGRLPALAALTVLAVVVLGLVTFEVIRYAEERHAIRHAEMSH